MVLLAGCAAKNDSSTETSTPRVAKSTVERGPVRATVEVAPASAALADELTLTLTVEAAQGVKVEKPPFGETLGDFRIGGLREPLPKVQDNRQIIRQILTLEPTCPGRFTIFPISVTYTDLSPEGDGKPHVVETEPLSVEVTTQVDERPSLAQMRGAAEPMGMNAPIPFWVWPAVLAVAAAAVVGWRLLRRRRRQKAAATIVLTPEEIANRELDELVASRLAERDIKQFYVELTGIVRRYIERTTAIRAPEQTTEEFLRELSCDGPLSRRERVRVRASENDEMPSPLAPFPKGEGWQQDDFARLRNFLEAADLVKFAAHRPRGEDVDESVRRARLFIGMRWLRQIGALKPEEVAV